MTRRTSAGTRWQPNVGRRSHSQNQGGYTSFRQGDVLIFKLEAHQLSLRVARLGAQTFTINTNGAQGCGPACAHTTKVAWSSRPRRSASSTDDQGLDTDGT